MTMQLWPDRDSWWNFHCPNRSSAGSSKKFTICSFSLNPGHWAVLIFKPCPVLVPVWISPECLFKHWRQCVLFRSHLCLCCYQQPGEDGVDYVAYSTRIKVYREWLFFPCFLTITVVMYWDWEARMSDRRFIWCRWRLYQCLVSFVCHAELQHTNTMSPT